MATPATPSTPATPRTRRHRPGKASFGSTRQLPSGRWQARYSDPLGNRHTAPQTFATKAHAEDWLATIRADMVRGTWRSPDVGRITLADYAADYLASRLDLAPRTQHLYRTMLRLWLIPDLEYPAAAGRRARTIALGSYELRAITVTAVRQWHGAALHAAEAKARHRSQTAQRARRAEAAHAARSWAASQGLTVARTGRLPAAVLAAWKAAGSPAAQLHTDASTSLATRDPGAGRVQVAHAYRVLRLVMQNALREGLIDSNPCQIAGAGQIKPRERVPASLDELNALAAAVPPRYATAVLVAAWSGLRAGELFGLSRQHVDLDAGTLRVERQLIEGGSAHTLELGPPKTPASRRTVHLPAHVVDALAGHLATYTRPAADALVFVDEHGLPLSRARRTKMFRRACATIGRPDLRWHDLRHTGATIAAQAGASLRELQHRLGHSTVAAAMVYQHASADRDRELAERMNALADRHSAGGTVLPLSRKAATA